MIYIVGSGPAGIACAKALLARKQKVTLLDMGLQLEQDKTDIIKSLQKKKYEDWSEEEIDSITGQMEAKTTGVPKKLIYGSDFPYRDTHSFSQKKLEQVNITTSLAKGGLSNVWGATLLPYRKSELDSSWHSFYDSLEKHYKLILEWLPLSGGNENDSLSELFKTYQKSPGALRLSSQAEKLLGTLKKNEDALREHHVYFGQARLALNTNKENSECQYCNLCLYGCPYELIFNSSFVLDDLIKDENFTYIKNVLVKKVFESEDNVEIHTLVNGEDHIFTGQRVFIGAGAIHTTKILVDSLNLQKKSFSVIESQHFLLPFFQINGSKNILNERSHTLSQVFMELNSGRVFKENVHLQIYTYNDLYLRALKNTLGKLFFLFSPFIRFLFRHLVIAQGYIHSNESQEMTGIVEDDSLSIKAKKSQKQVVTKKLKKLTFQLLKHWKYTKLIPIMPMLKLSLPGEGRHIGGTFPTNEQGTAFSSDIWGRPNGSKRIHAIDSSVFPNIPSSTITYTIMANAHRIGSEFDLNNNQENER